MLLPTSLQNADVAAAREHYEAGQRAEAAVAPWVSIDLACMECRHSTHQLAHG